MKKQTVRSLMIAAALGAAILGTMSLLAPTASADPRRKLCGGKPGGEGCPLGYVCVDFPGDRCDPAHGDSDCVGYCKPQRPRPSGS